MQDKLSIFLQTNPRDYSHQAKYDLKCMEIERSIFMDFGYVISENESNLFDALFGNHTTGKYMINPTIPGDVTRSDSEIRTKTRLPQKESLISPKKKRIKKRKKRKCKTTEPSTSKKTTPTNPQPNQNPNPKINLV